MKKVSLYLALLVAVSVAVTAFWVYQRYVRSDAAARLTFTVERGDIEEAVQARGEVVSQKEFTMEFPFAGTVEQVYVKEGEKVSRGDPLAKLDTKDQELEFKRLEAIRAQNEANLRKLEAGETPQDISVSESKVEGARTAAENAQKTFAEVITDSFTKADDAIRNKIDPLFINPGTSPQLVFTASNPQVEVDLESLRLSMESKFASWQSSLATLTVASDLTPYNAEAQANLSLVRAIHDKATLALNNLTAVGTLSQTTIDAWRAGVSAGRTTVSAAVTNLTAAREAFRAAQTNLEYEERALASKRAGTRVEDLAAARAKVEETENQIAAAEEKIAKATLRAPAAARVMNISLERREMSNPGTTAMTLSISEQKVQADISELDIGKIKEGDGNAATIEFDAFPDEPYTGRVVSVEPQAVVKDGDKYFRLNVFFDRATSSEHIIRTGMSADLVIKTSFRQGVLKVPELAVYKRNKQRFVKVLENGVPTEVEVKVGISNGESVEIISGLSEGQIVVVSEG